MLRRHTTARLVLAVLFLLAAIVPAPAMAQEGNRDYYNPGTGYNEASIFQNVHEHHLQPGLEAMSTAHYQQAYSHFHFILSYFPNNPVVLDKMSELCVIKWRDPKCEVDSAFDKAVERNPGVSTTYVVYGIHLLRRGKAPEAIEKFNMALALQPDSVNAHYNLGLAYFGLKKYELANQHAQASYQLGAQLPGLREKLVKAGKWQPNSLPQTGATVPGPQGKADEERSRATVMSK